MHIYSTHTFLQMKMAPHVHILASWELTGHSELEADLSLGLVGIQKNENQQFTHEH